MFQTLTQSIEDTEDCNGRALQNQIFPKHKKIHFFIFLLCEPHPISNPADTPTLFLFRPHELCHIITNKDTQTQTPFKTQESLN